MLFLLAFSMGAVISTCLHVGRRFFSFFSTAPHLKHLQYPPISLSLSYLSFFPIRPLSWFIHLYILSIFIKTFNFKNEIFTILLFYSSIWINKVIMIIFRLFYQENWHKQSCSKNFFKFRTFKQISYYWRKKCGEKLDGLYYAQPLDRGGDRWMTPWCNRSIFDQWMKLIW